MILDAPSPTPPPPLQRRHLSFSVANKRIRISRNGWLFFVLPFVRLGGLNNSNPPPPPPHQLYSKLQMTVMSLTRSTSYYYCLPATGDDDDYDVDDGDNETNIKAEVEEEEEAGGER